MTAQVSGQVNPPPEFDVAVAYTYDGELHDYIGNWETAQTMANEGYRIDALKGDAHLSRSDLQRMVDAELATALDCFGASHHK